MSEGGQRDDLDRTVERLRQGGHLTPALMAAYRDGELTRRAVAVSLEEIGRGLIQAANALGGYDNVTVVLVAVNPQSEV